MDSETCRMCRSGELDIACEVCTLHDPDPAAWVDDSSEQTEKLDRRQLEPWRDPARNGDLE